MTVKVWSWKYGCEEYDCEKYDSEKYNSAKYGSEKYVCDHNNCVIIYNAIVPTKKKDSLDLYWQSKITLVSIIGFKNAQSEEYEYRSTNANTMTGNFSKNLTSTDSLEVWLIHGSWKYEQGLIIKPQAKWNQ